METNKTNKDKQDSCEYWINNSKKYPDSFPEILKKYTSSGSVHLNIQYANSEYQRDFKILEKSANCIQDVSYMERMVNISLTTNIDSLKVLNVFVAEFKSFILKPVCIKNTSTLSEVLQIRSEEDIYRFWYYYFYGFHPDNYYTITDPNHLIDSVKKYDVKIYKLQQKAYKQTLKDCAH